jgi:valyl-tRNA synthetase
MLDTHFDPKSAEPRLYEAWEVSGAFQPRPDAVDAFSIVIPPPNVTGSLHIGHALNNTLQDILVRFERMRGKAVLWQPGLDHAGIATQMVVERQLAAEGNIDRKGMGREAFVKRVWEWKARSGGTILHQLRRLGASCDWSRERFTLDPDLSVAVRKVFVRLHREGLIYKDKRLVNWDPRLETALSDLEVAPIETRGSLWHIRYLFEDDPSQSITVATTRPETLLGDSAVAVHPDDPRYTAMIGRRVVLPFTGRSVPIIADAYADPEKGSGAVKITPAHDFNDFEVGRRHDLPLHVVIDLKGRIVAGAPAPFAGMDRFKAREAIVAALEAAGQLVQVEPITHAVPYDEKSKSVVLEPMLTEQWYCNVKPLADRAMAAVREGRTRFASEQSEKTFFHWLQNIQPWCVSRQLWWGHQIPAWYGVDGAVFVAETEEEALTAAKAHYGVARKDVRLTQDPDVLDTWFSSALWPFSTLGWPEDTPALRRFYPTNALITGHDIIFFWVARMMMMGLHLTGETPFADVYLHGLVRDAQGDKMSKTKGNVMDPLDIIERYGADALRFTLASVAAPGRDMRLAENRIEGYRNFVTKLWNAARFCQMNECAYWEPFDPGAVNQTVNRWIVGETAKVARAITDDLASFRFNEAAAGLYRFVWNIFCDWYLEFIKPLLNGDDEGAKTESRRCAAWVLDRILMMLHPFMPFVTEELWGRLADHGAKRANRLIVQAWPDLPASLIDPVAEKEIDWIVRLISETRSMRAELNVPPATRVPLLLVGASQETAALLERYQDLIDRLARLEYSTSAASAPEGSVTFVLDEATVALPLEGIVDIAAESGRLSKEVARIEGEISKVNAKLANTDFMAKAPEEVVEEQKERLSDYAFKRDKLAAALAGLKALM